MAKNVRTMVVFANGLVATGVLEDSDSIKVILSAFEFEPIPDGNKDNEAIQEFVGRKYTGNVSLPIAQIVSFGEIKP
jgi:hypothetical protein